MAYRATFTVDTQPLERAIASATPTLNNFEQRAGKVGSSLQRMVSEFDGTKLIQQATLLVGAIDKIGGASKLTEAEQRRVNSTLDGALAKYRALGEQAPKALTDLFNATKKVETSSSLLDKTLGRVGTVAAGVFAGFTVDRVVSEIGRFAKEAIDAGGRVADLSAKLGVSTTAIQRWDYAAGQNGNTVEQLGAAVTQLSNRLVQGDKSAVRAFEQLGLNVRELRTLAPEQAFEEVAAAIAKVPDPMGQSALAMAAFGKSGAEILPTIKNDLRATGDEAQRLGLVLGADTIKAMDELGDALGALALAGRGLAAQVFAPMVPLLKDIAVGMVEVAKVSGPALTGFFTGLQRTYYEGVIAQAEFQRGLVELEAKIPIFGRFTNAAEDLKKLDATIFGARAALLAMGAAASDAKPKVEGLRKPVVDLGRASGDAAAEAKKLQQATDAYLGRDTVAKANQLVSIYVATGRALPPTVEGQKQVNQALEAAGGILGRVSPDFAELYLRTFPAAVPTLQGIPAYLLEQGRAAEAAAKPVSLLTAEYLKLIKVLPGVPAALGGQAFNQKDTPPPPTTGDKIASIFGTDFGQRLGSSIVQAFAGGGSVTDTVSAVIGQALGKKIGQQIGQSLGKSIGESAGKLVGDVVGVIAGEAIGQVVGLGLDKLFKTEGKQVNDIRDQYVLAAGGIGELDRRAKEAGVTLNGFLKADSVQEYNLAVIGLERAFAQLETRVKSTVTSIGRAGEAGGLLSGDLAREILSLRDRPEIREALGSFLSAQGDRTIGGLNTFLANSQISSAATASSVEGAILAQFSALTSQGASPLEAIQQLQPAIEAFGARTEEVVGFQASAAFKGLQTTVSLLKDEIAGPALAAVGGLGDVLVGLQNQGLLTQDTFGGLARQVFDTFHGLELVGKGGVDAARAMQQPLQRTWELVKDFGYSVDEDTQKLLDFAESSGLIGDQFRPAADKMALAIDRLIGKLDAFVTSLSTTLVGQAKGAAGEIERAFNGINPDPIRLSVEVENVPDGTIPGFRGGSGGLVNFGRGTLAVLHGREAVLTEQQLATFAAANGAGQPIVVYIGEERFTATMLRGSRTALRIQ